MDEVSRLLREQDGVISRRQLLAAGVTPSDLARMVRRRDLAGVHPGVFVEHTGPLTWQQRAWAGVLVAWPAALSHRSAIRAAEGPGRRAQDDSVVDVAVQWERRVRAPAGVRVLRLRDFEARVQWNLGPPRIRYDDAIIDVAADAATDLDAVAALADACGSRRTTAERLLRTLDQRARLRRRDWLEDILGDVAQGTCSVLERGYLDLVVLDGRLFHDSTRARDRDLERDLDAATYGDQTLRLGYAQVFERGCSTAVKVAGVLQRHGWSGQVGRCGACP